LHCVVVTMELISEQYKLSFLTPNSSSTSETRIAGSKILVLHWIAILANSVCVTDTWCTQQNCCNAVTWRAGSAWLLFRYPSIVGPHTDQSRWQVAPFLRSRKASSDLNYTAPSSCSERWTANIISLRKIVITWGVKYYIPSYWDKEYWPMVYLSISPCFIQGRVSK
jgi:hypothetical protein